MDSGTGGTPSGLPLSEPIHQGSVYAFDDSSHADRAFAADLPLYARDGLPNVRSLERAVAALEGADDAHAVSSGMAAIATVLLTFLSAGDHAIIGAGGYCDTTALAGELRRYGMKISQADLSAPDRLAQVICPETRLIFVETISNPELRIADLPMLAAIAHERNTLLVVDNTFATPVLCRPLGLGCDIVVESAGKFLAGHHDVTAGIIAGPAKLIDRIRQSAFLFGPILAPLEAWLTLRGLKTLTVRVERSSRSALEIAEWLAGHRAVSAVRYPGRDRPAPVLLPNGGGAVLTFQLHGGEPAAAAVIERLESIPYVPSVGGTSTIVSFPPRTPCFDSNGKPAHEAYHNNTIRLSVGLESAAAIIAELDRALVQATGTRKTA